VRTLPDLLRPGLELVFVGINPGERSALEGHYYAHPGNGFWRALSASTLVEGVVTSLDDRRLALDAGIGFTDLVKRVVTDSALVTDRELRSAVPAFRRRVRYAQPRAICLTSTRALDAIWPGLRASGSWGRQDVTLEGATVWVMPSTSGRAAAYRGEVTRILDELADALGRGVRNDAA
jgi:TDG/mug DNA glycosylase family protein